MRCRGLVMFALGALLAVAADAQENAETPGVPPVKTQLVNVTELVVAEDGNIVVPDDGVLHVLWGQRRAECYIVVEIRREIHAKTSPDIKDLDVELVFGITPPVLPRAVVVAKKEIEPDKTTYAAREKRRWVSEVYYFPVVRGQREWTVRLNGKDAGKVLDFFATVVIHNLGRVSSRIRLPDGEMRPINGWRQVKLQFPAGTHPLVLEVRGRGKVELPWKKYDRGDFKYLAVVEDIRNAPVAPYEKLKTALPKIYYAYKGYRKKTGTGGGTYNLGTRERPIHVSIYFGRNGTAGPLWKCEADGIEVEYAPPGTTSSRRSTRSRRKQRANIVSYAETRDRRWKVRPWEKAEFVYVTANGREVTGEVVTGRFLVRSVEKTPSAWDSDGLLSKGVIHDKDLGYFLVEAKKQDDLVVVYGAKTEEP